MFVVKMTLPHGRSHYGHSDYIAFESEELANIWIEYDSIKFPEIRYSVEEMEIPFEYAIKNKETYNEEAKVLLEKYKLQGELKK